MRGPLRCWWVMCPLAVVVSVAQASMVAAASASRVAAGSSHTCAVTSTGALWCWGDNQSGQLGDGTTTSRSTPVAVTGLASGVVAVAGGMYHTCALTGGGAVLCWGGNAGGQLGDGTTTSRSTPGAVSGLSTGVAGISAGSSHTCALTTAGAVWCWGQNAMGQLGDGSVFTRFTPVPASGLESGVVAIAAGYAHTCALTNGGAVWCWGANWYGALGDGTTTSRSSPVAVSGLGSGVSALTAGYYHTCALSSGGGLSCWGSNFRGQLGDGTTTDRSVPAAVSGLGSGVTAVDGGEHYTCALTAAGTVSCWGANSYGSLGDGTTTDRSLPVPVAGLGGGVAGIAAGYGHTCAVTAAGAVWCWGYNGSGQVGDATVAQQRLEPTPTVGLQPATSDVGRDGRSDVVWHHSTGGDVWVWIMNGTVPLSQTYLATVADTDWQIYGLGDQTGDGKSDLLWRHDTSGALFLWTMDGTTVTAQIYLGAVVPDYGIVGTADYTGDGKSDVLWRHQATGELWLWRMNGATLDAVTWVATIAPQYAIVASGDLNGDGKADLLWHNQSTGAVWAWLMSGAVATSYAYLGSVADLDYRVAGLGDVNRDGRADVLWYHVTSGDVWVWTMDGTTIAGITHVATVADTNFRVVGTGDCDGDGKADVLWHHATRGELWVWLMNGAAIASATRVATIADVGYQVVTPR